MSVLTERINGHQKGRAVPPEKLYDFTFEGTGRTVQIRKLSALVRDEVRRQVKKSPGYAEPEPPMVEVDYGDDKKIRQPNRAHPVYQELLREWNARVAQEAGDRIVDLIIRRAVVCDVDTAAVAALRADMAAIGTPIDEYDDHYVYVAFVCVGPYADYTDLLKAVFERSTPTQEAVQAHLDSFRSAVRDEEHLAPEPRPTDERTAADPL